MPTVYLIDASPYIFRAFYSIPPRMYSPSGMPTNAVYGYTEFLIQVLKQQTPTHIAVAFDGSLTTSFRNEIYPAYKAQRELPPAELEAQIDACRAVTEALGMKSFIDDRFESDDIIGTFVKQLQEQQAECVIVSSDKDFAQLVNENVRLWDFARAQWHDVAGVQTKFGVRPEQIVDLLGLTGDSIDNIPGVKGIGPKTACELLRHFGNLEALLANPRQILDLPIRGANSVFQKICSARETAELSKQLVTIATDAPFQTTVAELQYAGAAKDIVDDFFSEIGFENIQGRIPVWAI